MNFNFDQIIRSNRKTIAIVIQQNGDVQVRAPRYASDQQIKRFVLSKKDWIHTQQKKIQKLFVPPHKYEEGEIFQFLGKKYPLTFTNKSNKPIMLGEKFILSKKRQVEAEKVFTKWYRERAREVFTERANFFARQHSFRFNKIRISSARKRWGSCSSKGTLSFTWRLVMAPLDIIDYVIIHELVHLKIKNHSSSFWAKVQELEPDFKRKRKWLRDHGQLLNIF
ncbi:M48 family metallopeptidase [Chloroflexota bacterium]